MNCEHCNGTLELVRGTTSIYECKKCHCIWRLCLVRSSNECSAQRYKKEHKEQPKLILAKSQKRKRGRKKQESESKSEINEESITTEEEKYGTN